MPLVVPEPARPLLGVLHTQVVPLHARTCPVLQVCNKLRLTLPVVPPPVRPEPAVTPVMVPSAVLVSVTVPPSATVPPPDNPVPAFTVTEEFASMAFVTPALGMLIVPLVVIGP